MRTIEKGESPYTFISDYTEALSFLRDRLGPYCSYCEMKVTTNLAVEHKESKNSGGARTDWKNLLLSCTYCNSNKGEKVKLGEKNTWIWPDEDNTFCALDYGYGIPKLNQEYLENEGKEFRERATKTFEDLQLGEKPSKEKRDTRFMNRINAFQKAERSKSSWDKIKGTPFEKAEIQAIIDMATETGFFSVWMNVFREDEQIKRVLIQNFPGTKV